jgi:deferrochelatase/peroxidase EfeB
LAKIIVKNSFFLLSKNTKSMNLELDDIQGFVVKGYTYLPVACYKMLRITDAPLAKKWLASLQPRLTTANKQARHDSCVNIALSYFGLQALKLPADTIHTFAVEFMDYPFENPLKQHDLRILGDVGKNAPEHWHWGGKDEERQQIHILLMLFADNEARLNQLINQYEAEMTAHKLEEVNQFFSHPLPNEKEHFGFRDGISQPEIEGYKNKSTYEAPIKAGEFILGYPNEYDLLPETPETQASHDVQNILPASPTEKADVKYFALNCHKFVETTYYANGKKQEEVFFDDKGESYFRTRWNEAGKPVFLGK